MIRFTYCVLYLGLLPLRFTAFVLGFLWSAAKDGFNAGYEFENSEGLK